MWWDILGVDKNTTLKEVKKAYASLLKGIDQEKDLEEFSRLQQAYKSAQKYLKNKGKEPNKIKIDNHDVTTNKKKTDLQDNFTLHTEKKESVFDIYKSLSTVDEWINYIKGLNLKQQDELTNNVPTYLNNNAVSYDVFMYLVGEFKLTNSEKYLYKDAINQKSLIKKEDDGELILVKLKMQTAFLNSRFADVISHSNSLPLKDLSVQKMLMMSYFELNMDEDFLKAANLVKKDILLWEDYQYYMYLHALNKKNYSVASHHVSELKKINSSRYTGLLKKRIQYKKNGKISNWDSDYLMKMQKINRINQRSYMNGQRFMFSWNIVLIAIIVLVLSYFLIKPIIVVISFVLVCYLGVQYMNIMRVEK